jgi:hypothetical protein
MSMLPNISLNADAPSAGARARTFSRARLSGAPVTEDRINE